MIFRQLFDPESSTFTYLLADEASREAVLIDPVLEQVERDNILLEELGLRLVLVLETHVHADHVTGADSLRRKTGARVALSRASGVACADLLLDDGQELSFGGHKIRCLSTPGHTNSCMSYLVEGRLFTGDVLFVGDVGRTDFQEGSMDRMFASLGKLFSLPDDTVVYPAHDYNGNLHSTIGREKESNARIGGGVTKDEFMRRMSTMKLGQPKKIHVAVPANLLCGKVVAAD